MEGKLVKPNKCLENPEATGYTKEEIDLMISNINASIQTNSSNIATLHDHVVTVNSKVLNLNDSLANATETEVAIPTFTGTSSSVWCHLFKRNGVVYLFANGVCDVPAGTDEIIMTMPLGYIPTEVTKITASLKKGDFDTVTTALIQDGAVKINGGAVGVTSFIITGAYRV